MDSCVVHEDCVSRSVAIITTLLYAMLVMVVLISLHWRGVSLEKLFKSYRDLQQ